MTFGGALRRTEARMARLMRQLPDRCSVERPATPQPIGGSGSQAPSTIAKDVPCTYRALNAFQKVVAASIHSAATHSITLPADTDVQPGDTIVVAARDGVPELRLPVEGRLDLAANAVLEVLATLQQ